jgi:hypothetical protein
LFDLKADPSESTDIASQRPADTGTVENGKHSKDLTGRSVIYQEKHQPANRKLTQRHQWIQRWIQFANAISASPSAVQRACSDAISADQHDTGYGGALHEGARDWLLHAVRTGPCDLLDAGYWYSKGDLPVRI